jgi:hypothetical protein
MGLILNFLVLIALAKSVGHSLKFYTAAIIYAAFATILPLLFSSFAPSGYQVGALVVIGLVKLAIGLLYFYLLDRYSDTLVLWLVIFVIGALFLVGA